MKILMTIFEIMDYGGIVNHVELLARGLKELGHEVTAVILRANETAPRVNKADSEVVGTYRSQVANKVNTITGWYGITTMGYHGKTANKAWRKYAEGFDGIIHQLPVPKADAGGWWKKLYTVDVPQVAIAHDAHFRTMYPHMIDIADRLVGVSVTNPAGYAALEHYPGARCFIGAPHVPRDWDDEQEWTKRPRRFVSAHVWKAWKHMDLVLRALPILDDLDVENVIGGDGIEGRYMRSKDKCKPRYRGIWKRAMKANMNYLALVSPNRIMKEYFNARVMVDLSYSKKFEALGNHFNRSTIEAYNGGCVPLVIHENMRDETGIFIPGKHYLGIKWSKATPNLVAERIYNAVHLPHKEAEIIVREGRELLTKHFDYRVSAQGFVDLLAGKKKIGIYGRLQTGKVTEDIVAVKNRILGEAE